MNNEEKFFENLRLSAEFIEEMLVSGASRDDVEELLFGCSPLPGRLPLWLRLPTSYDLWKNRLPAECGR